MDIQIHPGKLRGEIAAPPSKSAAHRALICAALADGESRIGGVSFSQDIQATLGAVQALGAGVEADEEAGNVVIRGIQAPFPADSASPRRIDCRESGSTLRFLLPLLPALGLEAEFTGKGRLPQRPIGVLADELIRHGAAFSQTEGLPCTVRGKLKPGRYLLPGNVSSQFFSGLLFALPLLGGDSEVFFTRPLESAGYVEMTLGALEESGVRASLTPEGLSIPGRQQYRPFRQAVEADYSNAAFWLCAAALGSPLSCSGLAARSRQPDRAVLAILEEMGAQAAFSDGVARITGDRLHAVEIDCSPIPDLVPVLAVTAACAEGTTVFQNARRLRLKECDRLHAVADGLTRLGAEAVEEEDRLLVRGGRPLRGGTVEGYNDHRIVMAMAIAATVCEGPVVISGAEAVEKSYPDFFQQFQQLGGSCHVL